MPRTLGVDLGGTNIRIGAIDGDSGRLTSEVQSRPSPDNWQALVDLLARHVSDDITGLSLAISGPIEDHARVIRGPNLPWLDGRQAGDELQQALSRKVVVCNDMEAAAEGELARGALRDYRWAIFDTISTGWGGNLILDGRRVDGEPGHANVTFDTPNRCGAGHVGCREALYSGSAMERRIKAARPSAQEDDGPAEELWDNFQQACDSGSAWAVDLLDDWAEGVGRAWANTLNRIRPLEAVVYMGTTAENLLGIDRTRRKLRETMARICMFPEHQSEDFPIVAAQEPDRAIYGAVIVFDRVA